MPPKSKKGKGAASTSQQQAEPTERDLEYQRTERFLHKQVVINERGMKLEPPLETYIKQHKWAYFVNVNKSLKVGDKALMVDFYTGLVTKEGNTDQIDIMGTTVDYSAQAINALFQLESPEGTNEYEEFLNSEFDSLEVVGTLTGGYYHNLKRDWKKLEKEWLTPIVKMLNAFISTRIMPTSVNSVVLRKRALLIFAILQGMSMDVGKIINQELHLIAQSTRQKQALGFPSLITTLCIQAGVKVTRHSMDRVPFRTELRIKDFSKGMVTSTGQSRQLQEGEEQQEESSEDTEEEEEEEGEKGDSSRDELNKKMDELIGYHNQFAKYHQSFVEYQRAAFEHLAAAVNAKEGLPKFDLQPPQPPSS